MKEVKVERNYSLDVVRVFALLCVISVHFFLKNGFYDEIIQGKTLFISIIIRNFFMICVPLFMVLSGYLMNKKEPSKKYFIGIKKIIIQYILCSLACFIFNTYYYHVNFSFYNMFFGIFNYTDAPYSWYVEMYLGLYIIIPFLNVLYNNLKTIKDKQIMLLSFILVSILPTVACMFNFKSLNIVSASVQSEKLLPTYWVGLYPITYYFVGCYLNEYKIKIPRFKNLLYILLSTLVFGIVSIFVNYKNYFSWNLYQNYNSLFVFTTTILVFIFISNINISKKKHKLLKHASDSVFCAYLLSYIFDTLIYTNMLKNINNWPGKFKYIVVTAPLVFICSLVSSMILMYVIKNIKKVLPKRGDINAKI